MDGADRCTVAYHTEITNEVFDGVAGEQRDAFVTTDSGTREGLTHLPDGAPQLRVSQCASVFDAHDVRLVGMTLGRRVNPRSQQLRTGGAIYRHRILEGADRTSAVLRPLLAAAAGERGHPSVHPRFGVRDILRAEEVLRLHAIDRVDRPQEVAFVAERHRRIDAHAAFELRVRCGPLLVAGCHALGRHEGLPASAGDRIQNVGTRIDARGQAPHHVVHRIGIGVFAYRDGKPHALRTGQRGCEEIALPALVDLVALLHLDDTAAPVGHAVWDDDVLHDARL